MSTKVMNIDKIFLRSDVQTLLKNLTGYDLSKIFKTGFNPQMRNSKMELLSQEQLDRENVNAEKKAKMLLQMPPFLEPRDNKETVLFEDERLNPINLLGTKYITVDISMNIPSKHRSIVVRENNGKLRLAGHAEREKMLQVYFPKAGKAMTLPKLFEPLQLEECIKLKMYLLVLNKACNNYEPNDPEFLRVTYRIYSHINETREYDVLHSTRFYGPMVFYLVYNKNLANLFTYYLEAKNINALLHIIKVHKIVFSSIPVDDDKKEPQGLNDLQKIKHFIVNCIPNSNMVELAYVNYIDSLKNDREQKK